ncbi:hypothetical protein [Vulcanisaeta distributa]|uniref:hypothetical protein n=1 Tax=Vulcanisaeta distributa TaxID=164451 RepID=UPI0006CFB6F0|nr:hypothetical protein [Vulcanisaeta distributa]
MSQTGDVGLRGGFVVVNDDGFPVDALSGLVLRDYVIEGTEERPVKTDPRARDNTLINTRPKVSPNPKIELLKRFRADMVGDADRVRGGVVDVINELTEAVMRVFINRGFNVHKSQVRKLVDVLMARWGGEGSSRLLRVLDCVLDVACVGYLGERSIVEGAIAEVFGKDWLVKQFIERAINEWNAQGVLSIDDAYRAYIEVSRMARVVGRNYPTKTLIDLAITYLILINAGEEDTRNYLSIMGREELLEKLRELMLGTR